MTDSTMTEIPLWDRLEAGANSIAVDGTPSQVGPTAEELHQAAAMLKAAGEALEEARNYLRDEGRHRAIDQIRILDRLDTTLAAIRGGSNAPE